MAFINLEAIFETELILPYNFWRQFIRLLECYVSYSQESNEFVILICLSLWAYYASKNAMHCQAKPSACVVAKKESSKQSSKITLYVLHS